MSKQRWRRIDLDNGWQAVVPETDIKPHSTIVLHYPDGKQEAELAGNAPVSQKWSGKIK